MKMIPSLALACLLAGSLVGVSTAQSVNDARADGKETARELLEETRSAAARGVDAARLPHYDPLAVQGLEDLADNPDAIAGAAQAAAVGHQGYRAIEDSRMRRARFAPVEIEAVIARAGAVSADPLAYTSGMTLGGSQGHCVELPPANGSAGTYTATCNVGLSGDRRDASCTARLEPVATTSGTYDYYCLPGDAPDTGKWSCQHYQAGSCSLVLSAFVPCSDLSRALGIGCGQPYVQVDQYRCDSQIGGFAPDASTTTSTVDTRLDESQCLPLAQNSMCSRTTEVCTDASPRTRIVNGVSLTRDCWAWRRDYQCLDTMAGNDCASLDANGSCQLSHEECLTDELPCLTRERIYQCSLPPDPNSPAQYICDGDVYCIDGSCETIERTANNEFKDAAVALNAMDQATREFDPASLSLFAGTRNTCSSKVFGVLNCCKGKGFPLIPGISLLVSLGCNAEEVLLHERDAQGLCAYVGSYCSDKVLGVCVTRKKAYCCFESKLSRIIQEQGRAQLPKPWNKPKDEQCQGFSLAEFAQLDLSQMDFSEVYAEFTDAARLPDELETSSLIQQRIEDFYARSTP
jgi:conjugal transfer mating pair stabilization protein TraN